MCEVIVARSARDVSKLAKNNLSHVMLELLSRALAQLWVTDAVVEDQVIS